MIEIPKDLKGTNLYDLLNKFDRRISELYDLTPSIDPEYKAIKEGIEYIVANTSVDLGYDDVELNHLAFLIITFKSTALFQKYFGENYLNSPLDSISYDDQLNLLLTFTELSGSSAKKAANYIVNMINFLLYYRNTVNLVINKFNHILDLDIESSNAFNSESINYVKYEEYESDIED